MTRIGILGGSMQGIVCGHRILDILPDADLHLIHEPAEMGLIGEGPGIFANWPLAPGHWVSGLGEQAPDETSTAVRRSWLEKAMATSLSFRGCTIHLRTRITDHKEDGNVSFVGAGPLGEGTIRFDRTMDALDREPSIVWEGGVFFPTEKKNIENSGNRSDGSVEVWWRETPPITPTWIQRMSWGGEDPKSSLLDDINEGILAADRLVDTIIQ